MSNDPALPLDPKQLRASNADRERVARVLNDAMAEGRISIPELQERLDVVYAAKTLGELEPVTRDLPGASAIAARASAAPAPQAARPVPSVRIGGTPTSQVAVAIMSGTTRRGDWVVPRQFTAVSIMGGVDLDLTDASFESGEVTITAFTVMGGVDIVVPDDITVIVHGVGIMGAFEDRAQVRGAPGAPVVRINGLAIMGGVDVKRSKRPPRSVPSQRRELD